MGRYLIRRIIISVITLIAISFVIFGILYMAPGDPLAGFAANQNVPAELRQQLREQMGLEDPFATQYRKWATQYAKGNWGISYTTGGEARSYVMSRMPVTLQIVGGAYLLSLIIAVPVGIISAVRQYSWFDNVATTFAFLGFSLPTFFTGLLMIYIFSVRLGWLPFVYDSQVSGFWGNFKQSIMPITVLALSGAGSLTRYVRASMLEVISQDYVRTARAKGLKNWIVVIVHASRNALIPVVTIVAVEIPVVLGGAVITEQIFRIPGIGSLLVQGIGEKDVPVVMAVTFGIAVLVVIFNIIADILYALLDPRIKFS
ncbi:MAG: ABC transporter permease [Thermomicrobiales bacterium]|jgi:peptide/nickel transport system permease protein|nr:ABC transporter permease [Thermomicrobiales bacterium]